METKFELENIENLSIHEYAYLTPNMIDDQFNALVLDIKDNGQLEPVKVCRGKIYDGRHRMKALGLLGEKTIKIDIDNTLSEEDIKSQVRSLENRRHQTPTQLAIMAYKEYMLLSKDKDTKENQGVVASRFGISRSNLAEVKSLAERAPDIVDFLFNGQKFNIGTVNNPSFTNNVRAINAFIREERTSRISEPKEFELTMEENEYINNIANDMLLKYGKDTVLDIAKRLYFICSKE